MELLISAVGHRTEHWTDLFAILAAKPELHTTVLVADVTDLTIAGLDRIASSHDTFHYHRLPYWIGEDRTGHMASITIRPGTLRRLDITRPDVIHIIGEPAYLSTAQLLRMRDRRWPGVPITHYAAQNVVTRFPFPFPMLERRAYRAIAQMLPITPAAAAVVAAKGYTGPSRIIPVGVDTAAFTRNAQHRTSSPFTVGFVGRLEPHKGVECLLVAAEAIDCHVLVVGRGSLQHLVDSAAARRPGRITCHDWVDHVGLPGLLRRMNVLALPSRAVVQRNVVPWVGIPLREQFGRVLVEAMACGVPVVGSDVGEISHVIGSAGLVIPPDDAGALAAALTELRDCPGMADRLGAHGIERVAELYSWERIADQLHSMWSVTVDARALIARNGDVPNATSVVAEDTQAPRLVAE